MKPETSATLKVIAVGCFIIFLVFLGLSAPFYLRQRSILKNWPTTQAKVESADITTVQSNRGRQHVARFLVMYKVGDRVITTLVKSDHADRNRGRAEEWLRRFSPGSTVTIAYNPEQPDLVRLDPGYNRYFFAVPLFITKVGLLFAAVALVLFWIARRADAPYRQASPQGLAGSN
ncbi:MAG TPA: DUF3592 domain-containing protein [Terriglobales bacterium]|nr:DUF3592 domain-containing protein [Terriglobales bacterium]